MAMTTSTPSTAEAGSALGGGHGPATVRVQEVTAGNGCPCILCGKYGCSCPPDPEKEQP